MNKPMSFEEAREIAILIDPKVAEDAYGAVPGDLLAIAFADKPLAWKRQQYAAPTLTREELRALRSPEATSSAAAPAIQSQPRVETHSSQAIRAAAQGARDRIKAILDLAEATTHPKLASHLAFKTDHPVDVVLGILRAAGPGNTAPLKSAAQLADDFLRSRFEAGSIVSVNGDTFANGVATSQRRHDAWDDVLEETNARRRAERAGRY